MGEHVLSSGRSSAAMLTTCRWPKSPARCSSFFESSLPNIFEQDDDCGLVWLMLLCKGLNVIRGRPNRLRHVGYRRFNMELSSSPPRLRLVIVEMTALIAAISSSSCRLLPLHHGNLAGLVFPEEDECPAEFARSPR